MQKEPSGSSQLLKQLTTQIVPDINICIVKSKRFQNSKLQCTWKLILDQVHFTALGIKKKNVICQQQKNIKTTYEWFLAPDYLLDPFLPINFREKLSWN